MDDELARTTLEGPPAVTGQIPVLYIAGTGRSGSTVLANVLGQLPGCVSVGEVRYVWERGLSENRLCGCGVPFAGCPFWQRVLQLAFGAQVPEPGRIGTLQARYTRIRSLPALLATRSHPRRRLNNLEDLPDVLQRLYAAIAEVSGASVIVDSSKLPSYAAILDGLDGLDVRALHLVRDPRAAAFSWRRKKALNDRAVPAFMERRGVLKSVGLWLVWNRTLEALWGRRPDRYLRLTYEAFVAEPRAAVDQVAGWLGVSYDAEQLFPEPGTANLGISHTVAGNPARLQHGHVALRLDDEWREKMPTRDRILVTLAGALTMRRYGY